MNSIERVKAAIHFDKPDKVPIYKIGLGDVFPMSAMPYKEWQPGYNEGEEGLFPHTMDDFVIKSKVWRWKKPAWAKKLEEKDPRYKDNNWLKVKREEIDQWGCIWMRNGTNATMGHPGRPSLPDWSKYEEYMERYTPDPTNESQYKLLIRVSKLVARKKYKLCSIGNGPLENGSHMRGFHNYLIDHRKHPQELKRMIDHFTEFYITTMKMFKKLGANPNGFILVEDLGEQSGPYFNPKLFTKFYEPFYRAICDEAHSMGCDMHQHCCGKVDRLIPNLIEWGLDALEFDSPRMSGYNDLKPYRGKIMFWGCVNIQSIYTQGTAEECKREVWHMMRNLGTKDGGFGAYFYAQPHHIKAPKENILAFEDGLKEYGDYSKIPDWWWDVPVPTVWKDDVVPPLPMK